MGRAEAIRRTEEILGQLKLMAPPIGARGRATGLSVLQELPAAYSVGGNYTEILQRMCQAYGDDLPQYKASQTGPDHAPTFRCIVKWRTWQIGADAGSKRVARDRAAFLLLAELKKLNDGGQISAEALNRKPPKLK